MKLHIANYDPDRIGGGWSFQSNLAKGLKDDITGYEEAEIYLITSPSMVNREDIYKARDDGKRIVLRLDNALRPSRNRNTGMTKMRDFCQLADLVIYQSEWAKKFLMPFTHKDGIVILNGVDTERFTPSALATPLDSYLYVRSSRDEGKQWVMAWYWFVNNPGHLDIVGKFSSENMEYDFDFYNNERFTFWGEQTNMPDFYRKNKHFLYTYLNDACSNTLLEARASGCEIIDVYGMLQTGGAPEIMACKDISVERMISEYKRELAKL